MASRRRIMFVVGLSLAALLSASMLAPAFGAPEAVSAQSVAKKLARTLKIAKRADRNAKRALRRARTPGPAVAPGASGPTGPQGPAGAPGAKGDKGDRGDDGAAGRDAFTDVGVAASTTDFTTTSDSFVDVTGASASVTVPEGRTATVIAHFSAETTCAGGTPGATCNLEVLLDGTAMAPAEGADGVFDSNQDDPGIASPTTFRLDDLSLAVQAIDEG